MYVGAKDPSDTITLTGHPNISLTIPGGSHGDIATASVVVNSIPVILDAPAGLRTARHLPIRLVAPRPTPERGRPLLLGIMFDSGVVRRAVVSRATNWMEDPD